MSSVAISIDQVAVYAKPLPSDLVLVLTPSSLALPLLSGGESALFVGKQPYTFSYEPPAKRVEMYQDRVDSSAMCTC